MSTAMPIGFQHQQPYSRSAAVRSLPSQRPGARLSRDEPSKTPVVAEEKSFAPRVER